MDDRERYFKLVEKIKNRIPSFKIKYKDESFLMKAIDNILFFNKDFMTIYTTIIGTTVYFPKRKEVEDNPGRFFYTLAHEYVHALDYTNNPVLFTIGYILPQILALLSFGAFLAFSNLWLLFFLFALIFLAPIPAWGRAWAEIRGFGMSCKLRKWRFGLVQDSYLNSRVEAFTGPAYFYMWPFPNSVKQKLQKYIESDECLSDKNLAYKDVYELVK